MAQRPRPVPVKPMGQSMMPSQWKRVAPMTSPIRRNWHVIDATDMVVGRLASRISILLQGKHKPFWHPSKDAGDYVIVKNCEKVVFSGSKWQYKVYRHYTGRPGGLKQTPVKHVLMFHPEKILERAIYSMLPKNKLRSERFRRLKVYPDAQDHHKPQVENSWTPPHINEMVDACKWKFSLFDPDLNKASYLSINQDGTEWVIEKGQTKGTRSLRRVEKRAIKTGRAWNRPGPILKSKMIPLTMMEKIRSGNKPEDTMENFKGFEKMVGWDDVPDEPPPVEGGIPPLIKRKPLLLPPPVYPKQKNLWPKIRAKWLQKINELQNQQRKKEKETAVYEGIEF